MTNTLNKGYILNITRSVVFLYCKVISINKACVFAYYVEVMSIQTALFCSTLLLPKMIGLDSCFFVTSTNSLYLSFL